jgi:hypothetical protein
MDANKREELLRIGYSIRGTCGTCVHGHFNNDNFGTCVIHDYQHLKHTGGKRQLSVYAHGSCPKFERGRSHLGLWEEFVK